MQELVNQRKSVILGDIKLAFLPAVRGENQYQFHVSV